MGSKSSIRVIVLVVLGLALAAQAAHAEPTRVAYPGTRLQIMDKDGHLGPLEVLGDVRFLVTRQSVDEGNTDAAMVQRLTRELGACVATLEARTKPTPGWKIAGKWTLFGIAVGGAFVLGLML